MDGEMVTKDVKKIANTGDGLRSATTPITGLNTDAHNALGVPFRGDYSTTPGGGNTSITNVRPGIYKGYAVNSSGAMSDDIDNSNGTNLAIPMVTGTANIFDANVVLTKTSIALGAIEASSDLDGNGTNDEDAGDYLYFTEKTKFILVSGTGTDTQKVAVYNGITELLGTSRQVTIDFSKKSTGTAAAAYERLPDRDHYRGSECRDCGPVQGERGQGGQPEQGRLQGHH